LDKKELDEYFSNHIRQSGDCPDVIFQLAQTDFERAVAIEFFNVHKKLEDVKKDIKWLKWLIISLFGAIIISLIQSAIQSLI